MIINNFLDSIFKVIHELSPDDEVDFGDGSTANIDDLWELIDKVKTVNTDHTSGWTLTEEHLEVENTDRHDRMISPFILKAL